MLALMIFTSLTHQQWLWINIAVVIVLVYILGLIINLAMVAWFKRALKTHRHGMAIAAFTKFDNISKLLAILKKHNIEVDKQSLEMFESLGSNSFKHPEAKEGKEAIEKLTYLRESVMSIARKQEKLNQNEEFTLAKNNVLEMDVVYRNAVAFYNADVLGYNYWIRFLPYRYWFLLFKKKEKDLI